MTGTDRRRFLKLTSALAAGSVLHPSRVLGEVSRSTAESTRYGGNNGAWEDFYNVIVIGAGLSGLMAARTLKQLGVDKVLVLEGSDRVGGRTLNQQVAGGAVTEAGGQWYGPTQTAIQSLMQELNIPGFATYNTGRLVDDSQGSFGILDYLDYEQARRRLDQMSKTVPLDQPWAAQNAMAWDNMTVQNWMDQNMTTDGGKSLIELEVLSSLSAKPEEVSFLYFLFYVHSATNLEHLGTKAQSRRVEGGSQRISLEMARQLGDCVRTDQKVTEVVYAPEGVIVRTNNRYLRARKLIVAMMPRVVSRMRFFPSLPPDRIALQKNWSGGPGAKFAAVYPHPFWRAEGLSGQAISDSQFIGLAVDNSPSDESVGILMGFPQDEDKIPATKGRRFRLTIDSFAHFFGPKARLAIDYKEYDWAGDPFAGGCVSPLKPQLLTQWGPAIRKPVGPIHWAGTETSEVWCGYMDGAIRAGQRAAEEVAARLP